MPPNLDSLHVDVVELKVDLRHMRGLQERQTETLERHTTALEKMLTGIESRVRVVEQAAVAQADIVRRLVVVESVQSAQQEKISGANQRLAAYAGGITVVSVVLTAIARKFGF